MPPMEWSAVSSAIKLFLFVGYGPEAPLPHNHSAAKKTFLFRYGLFAPSSFFIKEKTSGGVGWMKRLKWNERLVDEMVNGAANI